MFLMVCVILRMLGNVTMASFSPEKQCRRYAVHWETLQALTAPSSIDLID